MALDKDKISEAISKLTGALNAVEASADLMKRVQEEVKEMELNPNALLFAIKRAKKRAESEKASEKIELEDELYEFVWEEDLVK